MTWFEFGYQYLIGGAFLFLTLWLCFRPGASDREHPADRKTLKICILGFLGYFIAHALWIILAGL
jgi:drug/metabolite transporter (DMT)-like permease